MAGFLGICGQNHKHSIDFTATPLCEGWHGVDGKPEREDQALVEEPAPGVLIHMVYGHLHIDFKYKYVCMCGE